MSQHHAFELAKSLGTCQLSTTFQFGNVCVEVRQQNANEVGSEVRSLPKNIPHEYGKSLQIKSASDLIQENTTPTKKAKKMPKSKKLNKQDKGKNTKTDSPPKQTKSAQEKKSYADVARTIQSSQQQPNVWKPEEMDTKSNLGQKTTLNVAPAEPSSDVKIVRIQSNNKTDDSWQIVGGKKAVKRFLERAKAAGGKIHQQSSGDNEESTDEKAEGQPGSKTSSGIKYHSGKAMTKKSQPTISSNPKRMTADAEAEIKSRNRPFKNKLSKEEFALWERRGCSPHPTQAIFVHDEKTNELKLLAPVSISHLMAIEIDKVGSQRAKVVQKLLKAGKSSADAKAEAEKLFPFIEREKLTFDHPAMKNLKKHLLKFLPEDLVHQWHLQHGKTLNQIAESQSNVFGLLDSLILIDPKLVKSPTVHNLAAKILERSVYNRVEVISHWKRFCQVLIRHATEEKRKSLAEILDLLKDNHFQVLLNLRRFKDFLENPSPRTHLAERVLGALTHRHWSKGTNATLDESFKTLKEVTGRTNPCSDKLSDLFLSKLGEAVGRGFSKKPSLSSRSKMSLSTTSTLTHTRKLGGRLGDIYDRFLPWYRGSPLEDEVITVPGLKTLTFPKGESRFKTIFTAFPKDEGGDDQTPIAVPNDDKELIEGQAAMYFEMFGIDADLPPKYLFGSTGVGILYYHYSDADKAKSFWVPIRSEAVMETGGKARFVTILPWRDLCIQDHAQGVAQALLESHTDIKHLFTPSVPAWKVLSLVGPSKTWDGVAYVSDYSSATDAIDKRLARQLWNGVLKSVPDDIAALVNVGLESLLSKKVILPRKPVTVKDSDVFQLKAKYHCIGTETLADDETVITDSDDIWWDILAQHEDVPEDLIERCGGFVARSGVFMGEPLTKATLSILMYAIFEFAKLATKGGKVEFSLDNCEEDFEEEDCDAFFFAPGDDFLLLGNEHLRQACEKISGLFGLYLNADKVFRSKEVVPFCQNYLYVPNLRVTEKCELKYFKDSEEYLRSAWVETFKVKSLSPYFGDLADPAEMIAGKASSVVKQLKWLVGTWTNQERSILRDWMISRSAEFLPSKGYRNSVAYHYAFLPNSVGGLGLSLTHGEAYYHYASLSKSVRDLVSLLLLNPLALPELKDIKGMSFPGSSFSSIEDIKEDVVQLLISELSCTAESVDLIQPVSGLSGADVERLAIQSDAISDNDVRNLVIDLVRIHDLMMIGKGTFLEAHSPKRPKPSYEMRLNRILKSQNIDPFNMERLSSIRVGTKKEAEDAPNDIISFEVYQKTQKDSNVTVGFNDVTSLILHHDPVKLPKFCGRTAVLEQLGVQRFNLGIRHFWKW